MKFKINIYADGASEKDFVTLNKKKIVSGFTTNPSLMKKNGITNYKKFAKKILKRINKPISFEVFDDELDQMMRQAKIISSWSKKAYVKIPITNTKGRSTKSVVKKLTDHGIKCNVTAVFNLKQVKSLLKDIDREADLIISVFAGRISDTGIDAKKILKDIVKFSKKWTKCKILWASTREIYNIWDAQDCGCHIITVPTDMMFKIENIYKKNLDNYSLDTVKMFYKDAKIAGYKI